MASFAEGMRLGASAWDAAEAAARQKVLDERAAQEHAWRVQDRERATTQQEAEDAALRGVEALQGGIYADPGASGWNRVAPGAEYGPVQGVNTTPIAAPRVRDANDMDFNLGLQRVALARRDMPQLVALRKEHQTLRSQDDDRAFLANAKALHDKATAKDATPEDKDAWRQFSSPYASMLSEHKDFDFDVRVNPQTGAMEVIPYNGGKPYPVTFEQAAPFLLATDRLRRSYGDPNAPMEALGRIRGEERTRIKDDAMFRLGKQDKVGASQRDATKIANDKEHNDGLLGVKRQEAATHARQVDQAIQAARDRQSQLEKLDPTEAAMFKARVEVIMKGVETGDIKPAEADRQIMELFNSMKRYPVVGRIVQTLQQAHKKGDLPAAVEQLKAKNYTDEQIGAFLKQAAVPTGAAPAQPAATGLRTPASKAGPATPATGLETPEQRVRKHYDEWSRLRQPDWILHRGEAATETERQLRQLYEDWKGLEPAILTTPGPGLVAAAKAAEQRYQEARAAAVKAAEQRYDEALRGLSRTGATR